MTQSTTAGNTPLQLYPPKIKGQTEPVEPLKPNSIADVGVPLVAYDLVTDGNGAHVDVDPPPKGQMQVRDEMKLWLEGEIAELDSTTIMDPDAITALRIPKGRLHPDKVNNLFYTIERNSGNEGTSSTLRVLYNRIRPGLKDRYDSPGGHSELELDLSELIRNGVGADFVSAQVCVSYPYCRAYDRIMLKCNGELMHVKVANTQAPQPPNPGSETPTTICFTVTRAYLDLAKREDQKLIFSYTVTDQLGNGPDTDAPWSPMQSVDEDLDGKRLKMPILLERLEDFPGDDAGTIELEKLAKNDLLLIILTKDDRFVVDYKIQATFISTIPGQPDKPVIFSGKVEADPFGAKKTCTFKVPNKDVIVASSVRVNYELLTADGDFVARSDIATATVKGEYMELKPARVQQANGDTLTPMAAESQLTIVVPQGTTLLTDLLRVCWYPEPGTHAEGSFTSDPRPISEIGLSIDIPPSVLAFCLGDKVTVSYTITRGNGEPQPSDPFILNVQELPQAELIAPRLKEADDDGNGNELNLNDLTPEGKMWFSGFPFNAVGQYVWLLFKGTNDDGSPYEKYIWAAPFAFVNDDWVRNGYFEATAPYEDLKGLKDGMPLTMDICIAFGKSENLALAKRFLVRTYLIKATQPLEIDNTPMVLNGYQLYPAPAPYSPPFEKTAYIHADAHKTREAMGGVLPYQYSSSNPSVASVDSSTGHVVSTGVGSARISVADANGTTASYNVNCTNVFELVCSPNTLAYKQAALWMASIGTQFFPFELYPRSNGPFAFALAFSFQYLNTTIFTHYWCETSKGGAEGTCYSTAKPAYWESTPYVRGIESGGLQNEFAQNRAIGYRIRSANKGDGFI